MTKYIQVFASSKLHVLGNIYIQFNGNHLSIVAFVDTRNFSDAAQNRQMFSADGIQCGIV